MIFDIQNNIPVITPEALFSIQVFRDIWDDDEDDNKYRAQKELAYVYHMCDSKSVFKNLSKADKKEAVTQELFSGVFVESELIQEAIKTYKKLTETPALRLLRSSVNACDKLSEYFEEVDFLLKDGNGKALFTAKDVAINLEKVGNIRESLIKLEQAVQKEEEKAPKIRKGVTPNMFDSD